MIKDPLHKSILVIGLLITLGMLSNTVMATVTAHLERDSIHIDQTVRLIIETDDVSNESQPDFSSLNQNFNVLGTSTSKNFSIVNGAQSSRKQWIVELEPRAEGSFTIPSITIGNQESSPLRLTVSPREPLRSAELPDIFVEMEAQPQEAYVQQQVNLIIRLYLGVNILNGTLSEPVAEDIDIRRLGSDIQYESTEGNRNYRVIERHYALFPGKSGDVRIPAIRFNGHVEDAGSSGNQIFSGLFNQGTRVKAISDPLFLTINPPAPEFTGRSWLPAKFLEISDNSSFDEEVQVGQPITRQVLIRSVGLTAEQLPEIEFQDSVDFKQYPDKTTRETHQNGRDIVGLVNRRIAVIATAEGQLTLPSIQLNWWNTITGKMETASLPAKTVTVVAGPVATDPVHEAQSSEGPDVGSTTARHQKWSYSDLSSNIWMLISTGLLTGWVVTIIYFIRKANAKKSEPPSTASGETHDETSSALLAKIKQACKTNDPRETRRLLLAWSRSHRPELPPQSLEDISRWLQSVELAEELVKLDRYLYADTQQGYSTTDHEPPRDITASAWSGNTLYRLLSTLPVLKPDRSRKSREILPQLYPQWQ
jgi:hypothetical protein